MQRPNVLKLGQKEAKTGAGGELLFDQEVEEERVEAGNASKFI